MQVHNVNKLIYIYLHAYKSMEVQRIHTASIKKMVVTIKSFPMITFGAVIRDRLNICSPLSSFFMLLCARHVYNFTPCTEIT